MKLERRISQYIIYNFVPPGLLAILGYTSFYLSHPVSSIRALLLTIITLLVCVHSTGLYMYLNMDIPYLPYFTAFDIWVVICCILMSLAFVTFFIVEKLCEKPLGVSYVIPCFQ
jgi:hypothetical protein